MDTKTSMVLTKTYALVAFALTLFAGGLGLSVLYPSAVLSVFLGIFATVFGCLTICVASPTKKLTCISVFAIGVGYLGGFYCLTHGLETKDIVFCGFATFLAFVCASISALFTRSLFALYAMSALFLSISYIPVLLFYLVAGGSTTIMLIATMGVLGSLLWIIIDTIKVVKAIEQGADSPFELALVIFSDIVDLFIEIAKLMILNKNKKEKDDD